MALPLLAGLAIAAGAGGLLNMAGSFFDTQEKRAVLGPQYEDMFKALDAQASQTIKGIETQMADRERQGALTAGRLQASLYEYGVAGGATAEALRAQTASRTQEDLARMQTNLEFTLGQYSYQKRQLQRESEKALADPNYVSSFLQGAGQGLQLGRLFI